MAASLITSRFGASVRSLRRRLGISQEALAERADLHRTYISDVEGGARNVSLKTMERLARALEVSNATLLLEAGDPALLAELAGRTATGGERVDILMAEDSHNDAEVTLQAFKHARIANAVQVVHDGQEALDFLLCTGRFARRIIHDKPYLVLLDLSLPKIDGMDVLRRIKADERTLSIPVVVMTASRDSHELAECRRLGAEACIVKPVDFLALCKATPLLNLDWVLLKPTAVVTHSIRKSFSF
jgi:CheY-like chemotaxis protein/DNA-binding XRE family transcriptional regulator